MTFFILKLVLLKLLFELGVFRFFFAGSNNGLAHRDQGWGALGPRTANNIFSQLFQGLSQESNSLTNCVCVNIRDCEKMAEVPNPTCGVEGLSRKICCDIGKQDPVNSHKIEFNGVENTQSGSASIEDFSRALILNELLKNVPEKPLNTEQKDASTMEMLRPIDPGSGPSEAEVQLARLLLNQIGNFDFAKENTQSPLSSAGNTVSFPILSNDGAQVKSHTDQMESAGSAMGEESKQSSSEVKQVKLENVDHAISIGNAAKEDTAPVRQSKNLSSKQALFDSIDLLLSKVNADVGEKQAAAPSMNSKKLYESSIAEYSESKMKICETELPTALGSSIKISFPCSN